MNMTELDIGRITTGQTHLIEANAGTGKTYAITNLFLRWVLEGLRCREILVVTFTNAATDELRGRIRARLAEARAMLHQGQADKQADPWFASLPEQYPAGEARQKALLNLELALLEIGEAPIHTIHGFCQQTLARHALGSGQVFEAEQIDENAYIERFLADWWRARSYRCNQDDFVVFSKITGGFQDFADQVKKLVNASTLIPLLNHETVDFKKHARIISRTLRELAEAWRKDREALRALLANPEFPFNRSGRNWLESKEKAMQALDQALLGSPREIPDDDTLQKLAGIKLKKSATPAQQQQLAGYATFQLILRLQSLLAFNLPQDLLTLELQDARDFVRRQLGEAARRLGRQSFRDMIENLHRAVQTGDGQPVALANRLASEYPVIMVDEFQDTDPLQYDIFTRIHQAGRQAGHTCIFIGDPKQAIYAFRGGDIFTYMQARRDADQHWSLSVNWRSSPALIEVVNQLFEGNNPFVYEQIPYHPSRAPAGKTVPTLTMDGQQQPALVLEQFTRDEKEKAPNKGELESLIHQSVARHIARLLALGRDGRARLGERPLQPGDLAILVKNHREGAAIRAALLRHGVRAVAAGRDSIWCSMEAEALLALLQAAILPGERALPRQALAVNLFELPVETLHTLMTDSGWWSRWVEALAASGEHWRKQGFMAGFQHLLQSLSDLLPGMDEQPDSGWLARTEQPERTLTNLLHLADLLQAASLEHAAPEHLLAWMKARMDEGTSGGDETLPRLESDEKLVRITTIHTSKGLQYPLVFVPYLWNPPGRAGKGIEWHETDEQGRLYHYFAPGECDRGKTAAARERLAETVRLAYVALTRAESHCFVHFGQGGREWGQSALAWLFSRQDHDFTQGNFKPAGPLAVPDHLLQHPGIQLAYIQAEDAETENPQTLADAQAPRLACATFDRPVRRNWRVGSFSAMTRGVHPPGHVPAASGNEHFALRYPAGAHIGNLLHALLETIDPAQPLMPQMEHLCRWLFLRHGIPDDPLHRDLTGLTSWIADILATPLDEAGLCLGQLPAHQRLHELEFDLATGPIDPERVQDFLQETGNGQPRPPLNFESFQGLLTGAIDLVFEHQGRYYLADYKSNLLGRSLDDYHPERLGEEIHRRHYDLQYLLYSLALHRHLRNRLPDYRYKQHFGGVYYLFLRGMRPQHGPKRGVWFTRPAETTIETLDREIINQPAGQNPAHGGARP